MDALLRNVSITLVVTGSCESSMKLAEQGTDSLYGTISVDIAEVVPYVDDVAASWIS